MEITLYKNFTKKENSTKQPSGETIKIECTLKDNVSIYKPIFFINYNWYNEQLTDYTYLQWNDRYYYINDKQVGKGVNNYTLVCTLDPLATFKNNIYNSYSYILIGPKKSTISILNDSRIYSSNTVTRAKSTPVALLPVHSSGDDSNYVISYMSNTSINNSDVYTATQATKENYINYGIAGITYANVNEIQTILNKTGYTKTLGQWTATTNTTTNEITYTGGNVLDNAKDSVNYIKYAPFKLQGYQNNGVTSSTYLYLNNYKTNIHPLALLRTYTTLRSIPLHETQQYYYRNTPNFTNYKLFINAYGVIQLDPLHCINSAYLLIKTTVDQATGDCTTEVYYSDLSASETTKIPENSALAGQYCYNVYSDIMLNRTYAQGTGNYLFNAVKDGLKSLNNAKSETNENPLVTQSNTTAIDMGTVGGFSGISRFVNIYKGNSIDFNSSHAITATLFTETNEPTMNQNEINTFWDTYGQPYFSYGTVKDTLNTTDANVKNYYVLHGMNIETESEEFTRTVKNICANGFYYE